MVELVRRRDRRVVYPTAEHAGAVVDVEDPNGSADLPSNDRFGASRLRSIIGVDADVDWRSRQMPGVPSVVEWLVRRVTAHLGQAIDVALSAMTATRGPH